jgi:hypothetical protein
MMAISTIQITNQEDSKDRYGLLAKGLLPLNEVTEVYRVSKFTEYTNAYINITNDGAPDASVTIYIASTNTPTREDLLESKIAIKAYLTYVRGPITLSKGERVFILANTENIVYRLYGYDERTL